jgi:hypothetical protein
MSLCHSLPSSTGVLAVLTTSVNPRTAATGFHRRDLAGDQPIEHHSGELLLHTRRSLTVLALRNRLGRFVARTRTWWVNTIAISLLFAVWNGRR